MTEIVEKLADEYGWSESIPNFSGKLQRGSLQYTEAVQLADALGYNLVWVKRGKVLIFAWVGVVTEIIFIVLNFFGLADGGIGEFVASFAGGIGFGMLLVVLIFTSRWIIKFQILKKRILKRQ